MFCGIHLRAISPQAIMRYICNICLKHLLKLITRCSRINELKVLKIRTIPPEFVNTSLIVELVTHDSRHVTSRLLAINRRLFMDLTGVACSLHGSEWYQLYKQLNTNRIWCFNTWVWQMVFLFLGGKAVARRLALPELFYSIFFTNKVNPYALVCRSKALRIYCIVPAKTTESKGYRFYHLPCDLIFGCTLFHLLHIYILGYRSQKLWDNDGNADDMADCVTKSLTAAVLYTKGKFVHVLWEEGYRFSLPFQFGGMIYKMRIFIYSYHLLDLVLTRINFNPGMDE